MSTCNPCCNPDPGLGSFVPKLVNMMERIAAEHKANGPAIGWGDFSSQFGVAFDLGAKTGNCSLAIAGDVVTLTDDGAPFTANMVGKYVQIQGATSYQNDGIWKITNFVDASNIEFTNANGVTEAFAGGTDYKVGYDEAADAASRDANEGRVIEVYQSDFDLGTLRVDRSVTIKLMEDIEFNPNSGWVPGSGPINPARTLDWNPDAWQVCSNVQYFINDYINGYRLNFFAAIAAEAEGVVIDLNGYNLKFSAEFNLMQRFGALIELDDQPFRTQQGPAEFGGVIRPAKKVWIKNGTMGASHHNIHGQNNQDVLITDVVAIDAEVAFINLNAAKRVHVESCEDRGRKTNIPVLGTFSALRFGIQFGDRIDHVLGAGSVDAVTFQGVAGNALATAKLAVDEVFDQVIVSGNGVIDSSLATGNPALAVFQNWKKVAGVPVADTGLLDGGCYSMSFNPEGLSVLDFLETLSGRGVEASCISIEKCKMTAIQSLVIEVPAGLTSDGSIRQIDSTAAVFQFTNVYLDDDGNPHSLRDPATGAYLGTILANLQIAIAKKRDDDAGAHPGLFGFNTIDPKTIEWATDNNGAHLEITLNGSGEKQLEYTDGPNVGTIYDLDYGGDGMHHVIKGTTPLRMDGVWDAIVKDCMISAAQAKGLPSDGIYINAADGGNPAQTHRGYWGTRVQAIRLSSCQNVAIVNCSILNLTSYYGSCYGIEVAGESARIQIVKPVVQTAQAGTLRTETTPTEVGDAFNGSPNPPAVAYGIYTWASAQDVCVNGEEVSGIENYAGLQVQDTPVRLGSDS